MLAQLVESGCRREPIRRRLPALAFSVLLHGGALWGGIVLTIPRGAAAPDSVESDRRVYLPDVRTASQREATASPVVTVADLGDLPEIDERLLPSVETPKGLPPVDADRAAPVVPRSGAYRLPGEGVRSLFAGTDAAGHAFGLAATDEPPELLWAPEVDYPPLLRSAGIEGMVVVQVVIDTTGRPEPASLRVVSSAHRAFDAVARDVILRARYTPGRVSGRRVRVLVQVPIAFELREP